MKWIEKLEYIVKLLKDNCYSEIDYDYEFLK